MTDTRKPKGTVVTGVIGEDVHIIGVRVLEHSLGNAGFHVVPLGAFVSQEEFVRAAIETNADAIFVSSLCGHARATAEGLREKCVEAGLKNIRLWIGGMLAVDEPKWEDTVKTFRDMGYDRVYPPGVLPGRVIRDLEGEVGVKGG